MANIRNVLLTAAGTLLLSACGDTQSQGGAVTVTAPAPTTASSGSSASSAQPAGAGTSKPKNPESGNTGRCTSDNLEAGLNDGGTAGGPYSATISIHHASGKPCWVEGVPKLEFHTGGSGRPLEFKQVTTEHPPYKRITMEPNSSVHVLFEYRFPAPGEDPSTCEQGAHFAQVTLFDGDKSVEAMPSTGQGKEPANMPAICSAVTVWPYSDR